MRQFFLFICLLVSLAVQAQTADVHFLNSADGLSSDSVTKVFQDSEGVMWFGTLDGLNSWNSRNVRVWKYSKEDTCTISSNVIRDIAEDCSGYLWLCTDRGVDRLERSTGAVTRFFAEEAENIKGVQPFSLYIDSDGIYVYYDHSGVWHFEEGEFVKKFDSVFTARKFRMDGVAPVVLDKNNRLYRSNLPIERDSVLSHWIGCNDWFSYESESVYAYKNGGLYCRGQHLLGRIPVLSVCRGQQGIIWAGTQMNGVARIKAAGPMFATMQGRFAGRPLRCFLKDDSGKLLVGTYGSGVFLLSEDGVTLRQITRNSASLLSNCVYSLAKTGGRIWIGVSGAGLNYMDDLSGRAGKLEIPDSLRNVAPASVCYILPQGRDTLWLGTAGYGLIRAVINGNKLVSAKKYDASQLGSNVVTCVRDAGDGTLWVATRGGGVRRLFINENRVEAVSVAADILSLAPAPDGAVWAGTSAGLDLIMPDGTLRHYCEADGLPNRVVHGVVPGRDGAVWLSTGRGLAKLDPVKGECYSYTTADGLQDNEFCDGAYYMSPDGRAYFGGVRGMTHLDLSSQKEESHFSTLHQEGFYVNNEPVRLSDYMHEGCLELPHEKGSICFRFVPLDYFGSQRCELKYKLDGFDRDWVQIGNSSAVVFSNLRPGKYTLRVKTSSADGEWGDSEYALPIRVIPHWWESPLAFMVYLALLAAIVLLIYGLRRSSGVRGRRLDDPRRDVQPQAERPRPDRIVSQPPVAPARRPLQSSRPAADTPHNVLNDQQPQDRQPVVEKTLDELWGWSSHERHSAMEKPDEVPVEPPRQDKPAEAEMPVKDEDKAIIDTITQIIVKNLENEDLSIDQVAQEASISKMQLYRKLRAAVDMTPTEYIRHIRLENARTMLKSSNKTALAIMLASGFSNKTYFYREFKKKYGMTPKQYREEG